MDAGLIFILAMVGLGFYFIPTFIAASRRTKCSTAIFWLNFVFGWTLLGWLAALIWAFTDKEAPPPSAQQGWSEPFYK